jgi:hypothetical protein
MSNKRKGAPETVKTPSSKKPRLEKERSDRALARGLKMRDEMRLDLEEEEWQANFGEQEQEAEKPIDNSNTFLPSIFDDDDEQFGKHDESREQEVNKEEEVEDEGEEDEEVEGEEGEEGEDSDVNRFLKIDAKHYCTRSISVLSATRRVSTNATKKHSSNPASVHHAI